MSKPVPCEGCEGAEYCVLFLKDRFKKYEEDIDLCEDYNSESIYHMGKICSMLDTYLYLGQVAFPSRNYHFLWSHTMRVGQDEWIDRLNQIREYFIDEWVPLTF